MCFRNIIFMLNSAELMVHPHESFIFCYDNISNIELWMGGCWHARVMGVSRVLGEAQGSAKRQKYKLLNFEFSDFDDQFLDILRNYANVMINIDLENASILSDVE